MKTDKLAVVLPMFCLLTACQLLEPEPELYKFRVNNDTSETLYVWIDPPSPSDANFRLHDTPAPPDGIVNDGDTKLIDMVTPGAHLLYAEAPYNQDLSGQHWIRSEFFDDDFTWSLICGSC